MKAVERAQDLTVDGARRWVAAQLKAQDIETPALDARLLLGGVMNLDLKGMVTSPSRRLTDDEVQKLEAFLKRRIAGEPIARILEMKEFWGLPLKLSAETLVPRPDTETIVEAALSIARALPKSTIRVADLGTGSGAILLALLSELPHAVGVGTDVSVDALRTARSNANALGLGARATFSACNYSAALKDNCFDVVVSNPPYIRSSDIAGLAPEVRDCDPRLALDGGADGLGAYRQIAADISRVLVPGGTLAVEVGYDQSAAVEEMLRAVGLSGLGEPRRDLAGIERVVTGRRCLD